MRRCGLGSQLNLLCRTAAVVAATRFESTQQEPPKFERTRASDKPASGPPPEILAQWENERLASEAKRAAPSNSPPAGSQQPAPERSRASAENVEAPAQPTRSRATASQEQQPGPQRTAATEEQPKSDAAGPSQQQTPSTEAPNKKKAPRMTQEQRDKARAEREAEKLADDAMSGGKEVEKDSEQANTAILEMMHYNFFRSALLYCVTLLSLFGGWYFCGPMISKMMAETKRDFNDVSDEELVNLKKPERIKVLKAREERRRREALEAAGQEVKEGAIVVTDADIKDQIGAARMSTVSSKMVGMSTEKSARPATSVPTKI